MSDGLPRDLVDVILKAIRGHMSDVHVALPGRVLRYDNATNTADVEVQVKRAVWDDDNAREYEELPVLPAVPVLWPRTATFMLAMPLAKDDMVLLVFNDIAIGEWRQNGEVSEPWDGRRHSLGYPVALPGFFPDKTPPGDASARAAGLVLGKVGTPQQVRIDGTNITAGVGGAPVPTQADNAALLTALATFLAPANWTTIGNAASAAATFLTAITTPQPAGAQPVYTTIFKAK